MTSKIIVLGAVNGRLQQTLAKLATLHAKNNFTLAIVTGNLFSEDDAAVADLIGGKIIVPLPLYFTVGSAALPQAIIEKIEQHEEICPNLHYLDKRSTTKTSEGIKIVTLGGQLDDTVIGGTSKEQYLPFHTAGDARVLQGAHDADILLTAIWPASIQRGSKTLPEGVTHPPGHEHIAELCAVLKPRYHFSTSSDFFYEREPFFHNPTPDDPTAKFLTRFISLAPQGTPNKQKALYAFSLAATADLQNPLPSGTTASPFASLTPKGPRKRPVLDSDPYRQHNGRNQKRGRGRGGQRQPPPGPDQCFFCLSNPNLATHLISSIGEDAYLTLAKGPLTTSTTYQDLGLSIPAHALIIPLTHSPTINLIVSEDDPEAKAKTFAEMTRFKEVLQNFVAKSSKNKLGAVIYEISKADGVHTHWQFLPVPTEHISKGLVEAAFRVEAENLSYPSFQVRDPGIGSDDGDFFRVWIWTPPSSTEDGNSQGSTKCLTMAFDDTIRFSLQFGRVVMAKLLGLENRIQWRDCAQTVDEEKADIAAFKAAFRDFDFTIESDETVDEAME